VGVLFAVIASRRFGISSLASGALMHDPVAILASRQGPARHAWWRFWVRVQGWAFSRALNGGGEWSPSWVLGWIAAFLGKLERYTR